MSLVHASNSALPSIVGYSALGLGVLSAGSLLFGGLPIINVQGSEVADFAASALAAIGGSAILKSREPVAAWMGLGIIALALTYANVSVDTLQASRMLEAAKQAATHSVGYSAAKNRYILEGNAGRGSTSTPVTPWQTVRPLNEAEIAECVAGTQDWTRTPKGRLNCSLASDGKRYVWRAAP
ncbi:hypothetical protein [Thiofilum flexile]|uniref:hypothetical protein n=1 Tax=Thiofilum flexile TaxID=125627 RepID=UPI00036160C1|nr:hypothetical protein [Thiofilum flexile]